MSYIVNFYDKHNHKNLSVNELEHLPSMGNVVNLSGAEYRVEKITWILEKSLEAISSLTAIDITLVVIPNHRTMQLDKFGNAVRCDECGCIIDKGHLNYRGQKAYCDKH